MTKYLYQIHLKIHFFKTLNYNSIYNLYETTSSFMIKLVFLYKKHIPILYMSLYDFIFEITAL